MNPRHARFVSEYLKHGVARKAAIAAGYAPSRAHVTGSQLVKRGNIAEEIARRQGEIAKKADVKVEEIIQFWVSWIRDKDADPNIQMKASQLLAKHLGMFIQRHEVGRPGDFDQLTHDDLEKEILELADRRKNSIPGELAE